MSYMAAERRSLGRLLPPWWWLLITGIAWMLLALILLRFDYTSVSAISILFGIVAFVHPGNTFAALAAVFSFFLVIAGTFDIVISISVRHEIDVWWVQLITGIIEILLGLWAAGYYGRSAVLLVAWVAAIAIMRGIRDIVLAFRVRDVQHSPPAPA